MAYDPEQLEVIFGRGPVGSESAPAIPAGANGPAGPNTKNPYENPKDRVGAKKPSLWVVPSTAMLHLGMAMRDGGHKYGPYNWREKAVVASIYWDAKFRHMLSWLAGEEYADDSGIHHLGHDMACSAILLDAWHHGNLIDDRPKSPQTIELLKALHAQISAEKRDENGRLIIE